MNEAAPFGDLALRQHDFSDTSGRVQQLYLFFAEAYRSEASFSETISF